jgi:tetratricopeptide (TPR) repeat protein
LEELSEDDLYIEPEAESMPDEVSQPASSGSSFLEELQEDNQGTSLEGEKAASASASPWDFLTDDLVSSNIEDTDPAAPPLKAPDNAFGISEDELWRRAQAFIGDVKLPESLSPENQAAEGAKIERGAFSFSDAPPSLAAQLSVRSDLAPLTEEQIKAALGVEPAEDKADKQEKAPKQAKPRRGGRLLGCLLLLILLPVVFGSAGWYLLRGSFYPTSLEEVREVNPELISTQVAELKVRYLTTAATPIPAPDWVGEAQELRYQNNFAEAEERLRTELEAEAGNVIGLATLSDLLRERPGGEGEALALAQEASAAATTAEERARASESYVWALAHQAQPDVGQALASAEEALEETPESPHAFWALAMARALAGNADGSREALLSASALSEEVQAGAVAAQEAEVYARMGELEEAVALYEDALQETDYIPWGVELVKIKRQLEHPDSQTHLDHLREIAPDDPAVQQLGQ